MPDSSAAVSPFGSDVRQRHAAAQLGIWLFLATEVLFFGGLFASYTIYRTVYAHAFTVAARETALLLGTINTAILVSSGLTMALAVKVEKRDRALSHMMVIATILLALGFLGVKGYEYSGDLDKGLMPGPGFPLVPAETQIFWALYWLMTGLHTVHVLLGISWLTAILLLVRRGALDEHSSALEVAALYWGFVDMVWLFLYPMLYLVGRSG